MEDACLMFDNPRFSDVRLDVTYEDTGEVAYSLRCHKAVLAGYSPLLLDMLDAPDGDVVTVPVRRTEEGEAQDAVRLMVEAMYTRRFPFAEASHAPVDPEGVYEHDFWSRRTHTIVLHMVALCDKFDVKWLLLECIRYIKHEGSVLFHTLDLMEMLMELSTHVPEIRHVQKLKLHKLLNGGDGLLCIDQRMFELLLKCPMHIIEDMIGPWTVTGPAVKSNLDFVCEAWCKRHNVSCFFRGAEEVPPVPKRRRRDEGDNSTEVNFELSIASEDFQEGSCIKTVLVDGRWLVLRFDVDGDRNRVTLGHAGAHDGQVELDDFDPKFDGDLMEENDRITGWALTLCFVR